MAKGAAVEGGPWVWTAGRGGARRALWAGAAVAMLAAPAAAEMELAALADCRWAGEEELLVATALWRKAPVDTWWEERRESLPPAAVAAGGVALPEVVESACVDDTWTPTAVDYLPAARYGHVAVWTGTEMLVWGGYDGANVLATVSNFSALEPPGTALRLERSRGGLPVVVAELGGETVRLAIDTGTTRSMIAGSVAERLRLAPRARYLVVTSAGAPRTAYCAGPVEAVVGEVRLAIDCLGWVPEERLLAGAEDLDSLLGADALGGVDLWIDLRRGRARLAPPGALARWVDGERLAVELVERRPAIQVTLPALGRGSQRVQLVIDSGADGALLFGELARRTASSLGRQALPGQVATASGSARLATVPLGELRAGRKRIEAGWAGLLPEVVDRREDGLLPIDALGPVLIDLSGEQVVVGARWRSGPAPQLLAAISGAAPETVAKLPY